MCINNSLAYGKDVASRVNIICADVVELSESARIKADVVFLSPPWGGPSYKPPNTETDQVC